MTSQITGIGGISLRVHGDTEFAERAVIVFPEPSADHEALLARESLCEHLAHAGQVVVVEVDVRGDEQVADLAGQVLDWTLECIEVMDGLVVVGEGAGCDVAEQFVAADVEAEIGAITAIVLFQDGDHDGGLLTLRTPDRWPSTHMYPLRTPATARIAAILEALEHAKSVEDR